MAKAVLHPSVMWAWLLVARHGSGLLCIDREAQHRSAWPVKAL